MANVPGAYVEVRVSEVIVRYVHLVTLKYSEGLFALRKEIFKYCERLMKHFLL
jgi:hypothetical protein